MIVIQLTCVIYLCGIKLVIVYVDATCPYYSIGAHVECWILVDRNLTGYVQVRISYFYIVVRILLEHEVVWVVEEYPPCGRINPYIEKHTE